MTKQPRSIICSSTSIQVAGDFGGGYRSPSSNRDTLLKAIIYCSPLGELGGSIIGSGDLLSEEEKIALRKRGWEITEAPTEPERIRG